MLPVATVQKQASMLEAVESETREENSRISSSDQPQTIEPEPGTNEMRIGTATQASQVSKSVEYHRTSSHENGIASLSSDDQSPRKKVKFCRNEDTTITYGKREKGTRCVTIKIFENSEWWSRLYPFNLEPLAGNLCRKIATKTKTNAQDSHPSSNNNHQRSESLPRTIATRCSRIEIPGSLRHVFETNSAGVVEMKSPFVGWWNKLADAANENWIGTRVLQGTSNKGTVILRDAELDPPNFHDLKVAAWNFLRRLVCKGVAERVLIFSKSQINGKIDGSFVKLFCILAKRSRVKGMAGTCLEFPVVCERDERRYRSRCWFCFRLLTVVRWSEKKTIWDRSTDHLINQHDQTKKLRNLIHDAKAGIYMFSFFDYLQALQLSVSDLYVLRRALDVEGQQLYFDDEQECP